MFTQVLLIIQCCKNEADDADRVLFVLGREYPQNSSLLSDYSKHGDEYTDGSYIVEGKVHVNKFYWLKVTGVNY